MRLTALRICFSVSRIEGQGRWEARAHKGLSVKLRTSRIDLRSPSGEPAVKPVKMPSPPALETAATSFGSPTHLQGESREVSLHLRATSRFRDAHHAALNDGSLDAERLCELRLDPAEEAGGGDERERGGISVSGLPWELHSVHASKTAHMVCSAVWSRGNEAKSKRRGDACPRRLSGRQHQRPRCRNSRILLSERLDCKPTQRVLQGWYQLPDREGGEQYEGR